MGELSQEEVEQRAYARERKEEQRRQRDIALRRLQSTVDPTDMAPQRFTGATFIAHAGKAGFTSKGQLEVRMLILPAFVDNSLVMGTIQGLPIKVTVEPWDGRMPT